jgi:ParB-like chromosome segregation protein Spo0J
MAATKSKKSKAAAEVVTPATASAAPATLQDPTWIELGVNSRVYEEADQKQKDLDRAISIFEHGQKVPVILRKRADDKLELVAGFGRLRSVNLLRAGFEHKGEKYHLPDLQILAQVDETLVDDKAAFIASIIENRRDEVSPLNVAEAQRRLRDEYGLSERAIGRLYGYANPNSVIRHKKLLETPAEIQKKVHAGDLSLDAANNLMKLPEERREKLLKDSDKLTSNVIAEELAKAEEAKAAKPDDAGGDKPDASEKPAVTPRNAAALNQFIDEELLAESDGLPEDWVKLAKATKQFLAGSITTKTYATKWAAVAEALGHQYA